MLQRPSLGSTEEYEWTRTRFCKLVGSTKFSVWANHCMPQADFYTHNIPIQSDFIYTGLGSVDRAHSLRRCP